MSQAVRERRHLYEVTVLRVRQVEAGLRHFVLEHVFDDAVRYVHVHAVQTPRGVRRRSQSAHQVLGHERRHLQPVLLDLSHLSKQSTLITQPVTAGGF